MRTACLMAHKTLLSLRSASVSLATIALARHKSTRATRDYAAPVPRHRACMLSYDTPHQLFMSCLYLISPKRLSLDLGRSPVRYTTGISRKSTEYLAPLTNKQSEPQQLFSLATDTDTAPDRRTKLTTGVQTPCDRRHPMRGCVP